ncbi:hypothetical protein ACI6Q2_05345 [Chitinophagaceae bacterium LWZ2-11]
MLYVNNSPIIIVLGVFLLAGIFLLSKHKKHIGFSPTNYNAFTGTVSFTKENIVFVFQQDRGYVDWDFFKCYIEADHNIYLFPANKLDRVFTFSCSDIGCDNYNDLKQIIRNKKIACGCDA